jgi:hypothetical protein
VMPMRRGSSVMLPYLTNLSMRYFGSTNCRKLRNMSLESLHWHHVHAKFHENPSCHSPIIKCVHADISSEEV